MPVIQVEIDQFGNPVIKAEGFKGVSCQRATASLEAALKAGSDRVKIDRLPEMYIQENAHATPATVTMGGK